MFSSNASNTHQQISTETVLAKRHKSPTLLGEIPSHQNHQIVVVVVSSSIASSCWSCSLIGSKWSAWRNPAVGWKNLSLHLPLAMATRPSATHLMYLSIHLNSWLLHKRYPCYLSSKNLLSRNFGHFSYLEKHGKNMEKTWKKTWKNQCPYRKKTTEKWSSWSSEKTKTVTTGPPPSSPPGRRRSMPTVFWTRHQLAQLLRLQLLGEVAQGLAQGLLP